MNEKRQKEAFVGVRRVKIGENKFSATGENQKTLKIAFPNIGKNKKCHWLHFPTLGKTKNPESLLSDFRGSVHFDTSSRDEILAGIRTFHYFCDQMGKEVPNLEQV